MSIDKQRALTDAEYRKSLTPAELAEFESQLTDEEIDKLAGGLGGIKQTIQGCLAQVHSVGGSVC